MITKTNQIKLPKLHESQVEIINSAKRFNVVCCGRRFGKNIIAEDLLVKGALSGKLVTHIEPSYKMLSEVWRDLTRILKPAIKSSNQSESRIELNTGGVIDFWSLENFESIRGRKYHLAVINEAAMFRYLREAWTEVIRPTLTDYKGSAWFLSTPKGDNYFKELYDLKDSNWKSFQYTSYDNPKIDPKEIDMAKTDIPELVFRQEYMAEFVTGAGTLLSREYIKTYSPSQLQSDLDIVIGVDLAISQKDTADYTVILTLGKDKSSGNIYIIDVYRDRINFNQSIEKVKLFAEKYKPRVIGIEQVSYQAAIVQELLRTTTLNIKGVKPDKDKITRFQPIQARFEQGLVYINETIHNDFRRELLSFPLGNHDDQVDALSLAYSLLNKPQGGFLF